jgi:hypothetical protein
MKLAIPAWTCLVAFGLAANATAAQKNDQTDAGRFSMGTAAARGE